MTEWWTYRLSDFLLFGSDTYYRLFELYNHAIWPAQLLAIPVAALLVYGLRRATPRWLRACYLLVAPMWVVVAWAYHLQHYQSINWAARYYAMMFGAQAVLLALLALLGTPVPARTPMRRYTGWMLLGYALLVHPLLTPLLGRESWQVEVPGFTPDPTAVLTIALLLLAPAWPRVIAWIVPVAWCVVSAATLWTMHSPEAWVLPVVLAAVAVVVVASLRVPA